MGTFLARLGELSQLGEVHGLEATMERQMLLEDAVGGQRRAKRRERGVECEAGIPSRAIKSLVGHMGAIG